MASVPFQKKKLPNIPKQDGMVGAGLPVGLQIKKKATTTAELVAGCDLMNLFCVCCCESNLWSLNYSQLPLWLIGHPFSSLFFPFFAGGSLWIKYEADTSSPACNKTKETRLTSLVTHVNRISILYNKTCTRSSTDTVRQGEPQRAFWAPVLTDRRVREKEREG